ncbi:hypothetical protein CU098_013116 [Rhizopus stolonifer]|uniref:Uncharacterized protein n=1 Tax=Rhizopus stolonifer TaxID=4846 RepID=A0A367KQL5_RHIST|nr:hypothetical protein CU098_013116 [Rhizopus stolonifer]
MFANDLTERSVCKHKHDCANQPTDNIKEKASAALKIMQAMSILMTQGQMVDALQLIANPSDMTSAPGIKGSDTADAKKIIVPHIVFDGDQTLYLGLESKARTILYTVDTIVGMNMYTEKSPEVMFQYSVL